MSEPLAIRASGLSKCYQIYDRPQDRLWQGLMRGRRRFYREFWALRETSFELRRGETVGVIGRNGSGKSTLLQIICGTLTPTTGTLEVNGRISALLELGSGFNPDFTGRENVYLNGAIHGLSSAQVDARFDEIAAFADIGEFIDQPVKTYSSGMYARLAFSSAIFVDPDILVIDEILAVGDAPFQAKCIQAFHRLRDRGCTILLVSHDAYMIRNFCQRALYLRKGECMGFGDSSEVIEAYNLEIETAMAPKAAPAAAVPADGGPVAAGDAPADAAATPSSDLTVLSLFRITGVELVDGSGAPVDTVETGSTMSIRFGYRTLSPNPPPVTFVFSLYRHDGLYVCGTTTLMDGIPAASPGTGGTVTVTFPGVRLLAGRYVWRVAIDDERAFAILAEANQVCAFKVVDRLEAVGLFHLERRWAIDIAGG